MSRRDRTEVRAGGEAGGFDEIAFGAASRPTPSPQEELEISLTADKTDAPPLPRWTPGAFRRAPLGSSGTEPSAGIDEVGESQMMASARPRGAEGPRSTPASRTNPLSVPQFGALDARSVESASEAATEPGALVPLPAIAEAPPEKEETLSAVLELVSLCEPEEAPPVIVTVEEPPIELENLPGADGDASADLASGPPPGEEPGPRVILLPAPNARILRSSQLRRQTWRPPAGTPAPTPSPARRSTPDATAPVGAAPPRAEAPPGSAEPEETTDDSEEPERPSLLSPQLLWALTLVGVLVFGALALVLVGVVGWLT